MATYTNILAGKFQGQRSLVGYSPCSQKESDVAEHAWTRLSQRVICFFCFRRPYPDLTIEQIKQNNIYGISFMPLTNFDIIPMVTWEYLKDVLFHLINRGMLEISRLT